MKIKTLKKKGKSSVNERIKKNFQINYLPTGMGYDSIFGLEGDVFIDISAINKVCRDEKKIFLML